MRNFLKTPFLDRWLWLCPALAVVLASAVFMLFGFTLWSALLAGLLLVCPAMIVWGAIEILFDERRQRAGRRRSKSSS